MTRVVAGTVFFGMLTMGALASAGTAPTSSDEGEFGLARCDETIEHLRWQLARVTLLGNVFTLVGAGVAALGSAVAGGSTGTKSRIAATIGVIGAITAAVPKTLPDRADIQRKISLADQHRVRGEKTVNQLPYLKGDFTNTCKQYAIARFVDCTADEPSANVPDLPVEASDTNGVKEAAAGFEGNLWPQLLERSAGPQEVHMEAPHHQQVFRKMEAEHHQQVFREAIRLHFTP
jgi:hypothetical protein